MSASSPPPPPPLLRPEPGATTLRTAPWGGERLGRLRGAAGGGDVPVGESWEFSTLAGAMSHAQGRPLAEILGGPLPFLAKLIDTAAQLSIQVHPADDAVHGVQGKEEAWIILDAAPGASVLAGIAPGIDSRQLGHAMRRAIGNPADSDALMAMVETIEVRRGMVLVIPAGTVHAVGGGILLAEIQQPVDCTYRLFDYGSARPIHPDAAAAAWDVRARPVVWTPDAPPRRLEGEHLRLQPLPAGIGQLEPQDTPRLLTAVGGTVTVTVTEDSGPVTVDLTHGDLALHLRGAAQVDVGEGALLVAGHIERVAPTPPA